MSFRSVFNVLLRTLTPRSRQKAKARAARHRKLAEALKHDAIRRTVYARFPKERP